MSLCLQESSSCRKPRLSIVHCCLLHRLAIFYRPLPWARTYCWVLLCAHVTGGFYSRAGWRDMRRTGLQHPPFNAAVCPTHLNYPLPSGAHSISARGSAAIGWFNGMFVLMYSYRVRHMGARAQKFCRGLKLLYVCQRARVCCAGDLKYA